MLLETNPSCSNTTRLLLAGHIFLSDSQQTNGDSPNVLMKVELPWPWVKKIYHQYITIPWEPTTFIFRGYSPYIGGLKCLKPSCFMVLGSKGT